MLIDKRCPNCGATMQFETTMDSMFCPFCGGMVTNVTNATEYQFDYQDTPSLNEPNLYISYNTIDPSVGMVTRIVSTGVKNTYINGQTLSFHLAQGPQTVVLKIGSKNYNRDIVIPSDNSPVRIYASYNGRAQIAIDQPENPGMYSNNLNGNFGNDYSSTSANTPAYNLNSSSNTQNSTSNQNTSANAGKAAAGGGCGTVIFIIIMVLLLRSCLCGGYESSSQTEKEVTTTTTTTSATPTTNSRKTTNIDADYSTAEDFEAALNAGEDTVGKTVTFYVLAYKPNSVLGPNLWAGEHLNFVSNGDPGVQEGDVITVKVTGVSSSGNSWIINYIIIDE